MFYGQMFYEVHKPELAKHLEERADHYAEIALKFKNTSEAPQAREAKIQAELFRWKASHLPAAERSFLISESEAMSLELVPEFEL